MTERVFTFAYWMDVGAKACIAAGLGIATWHLKNTGDRVHSLEQNDSRRSAEIEVLKTVNIHNAKQLDRIENKLDNIWEVARSQK